MPPDLAIVFIILLGFLVVFDLLTVAARTGFRQANLARLHSQRDQLEKGVRRTVDLMHQVEAVETSLRLGRLLFRFLAAGIILVLLAPPGWSMVSALRYLGFLLLAALGLFLLEEIVEAWAARRPEAWAIHLGLFIRVWMVLTAPVTGAIILLKTGQREPTEPQGAVTQDELISMLDAGHQEGVVEQDEREMIYSIFRLNDTLTHEIMVPRIYITALDVNVSPLEAVDALLAAGHSRIPVYEESVDNIIGVVYARDLLRAVRDPSQASLRELLREVYFVPEAKKVDKLLDEMQARQVHMAMVVDEYGGIAGLVTLEDIVEEIVGEIRDEFDQTEELPYQAVGDGEFIFLGRVDLNDFNAVMQTSLPRDEAETLSGFIYNRMGRVPLNGEKININDLTLTVEQVSGRRIRKVRARRTPPEFPMDQEREDASADR